MFIGFLLNAPPVFSQGSLGGEGSDAYSAWLDSFLQRLGNTMPVLSDDDKTELQDLLKIRPTSSGAAPYQIWLDKAFIPAMENSGPILGDSQIERLNLVMSTIPETTNASGAYVSYMRYISKKIRTFLPSLDEAKMGYLGYIRQAMPAYTSNADYSIWLKEYMTLKTEIGATGSDDEKTLLKFLEEIKPQQVLNETRTYQVSGDTMMKIRSLILGQQYMPAVAEIDRILTEGKK